MIPGPSIPFFANIRPNTLAAATAAFIVGVTCILSETGSKLEFICKTHFDRATALDDKNAAQLWRARKQMALFSITIFRNFAFECLLSRSPSLRQHHVALANSFRME